MNKPDKAGEPSMEEILASIRQIIADGPNEPAATVLLSGTELPRERDIKPDALNERPPPPTLDRFSGARRSKLPPREPAKTLSSALRNRAPFDNDLTDLLDDQPEDIPAPRHSAAASEPADALSDLSSLFADEHPTPVSPPDGSSPSTASFPSTVDSGLEREGGTIAVSHEASAPAPPSLHSMPPLVRRDGFYPPRGFSVGTPVRSDAPRPAAPAPTAPAGPVQPETHLDGRDTPVAASANRQPEGAAPGGWAPGLPPWSASAHGEPPSFAPANAGPSEPAAPLDSISSHPQHPNFAFPPQQAGYGAVPPLPASSTPPPYAPPWEPARGYVHHGVVPPLEQSAATVSPFDVADTGPDAQRYGLYQGAADHDPHTVRSVPQEAVGGDPSVTPASALDALAQGLAASSIGAGAARHSARQPAADSHSYGALVAQPLPPAPYEVNGYPVRTLEDAVSDMLKPLLQQWLADNMPRIIERALRVEAARGVSAHWKPPGN